jgi:uncharacterized RDD family membrane protein YckC
VDLLLIQVMQLVIFAVAVVVAIAVGVAFEDLSAASWAIAAVLLVVFSLQWGYFPTFEWLWDGQTPGKRLLGLRVVADDGGKAGPVAVLVRNLLRPVDFLPAGYFLGLVSVVLNPQSKRVGDLAAGTVVVAEDRAVATVRRWPPGLAADEVRLVETWFEREPALSTPRRDQLATLLVGRLRARHPDLVPAEGDAAHILYALFPPDEGWV